MARSFALTAEERAQLSELLGKHRAAIRDFESAVRDFGDDDDIDEDPKVARAVLAVRRAREALYDWAEKHLADRKLHVDAFRDAPKLSLADLDDEALLPNFDDYERSWTQLETEPNFADLSEESPHVTELEHIAKHGLPTISRAQKRALAKLADQAQTLAHLLRGFAT